MKQINGNKALIIGMAIDGKLQVGEVVYSTINKTAYRITEETNHQGTWRGVEEVSDGQDNREKA